MGGRGIGTDGGGVQDKAFGFNVGADSGPEFLQGEDVDGEARGFSNGEEGGKIAADTGKIYIGVHAEGSARKKGSEKDDFLKGGIRGYKEPAESAGFFSCLELAQTGFFCFLPVLPVDAGSNPFQKSALVVVRDVHGITV